MQKSTYLFAILIGIFLSSSLFSNAQKVFNNDWQLSLNGGLSLPLGDYKGTIGRATPGYNVGVGIEKFFIQGKWGLRLDGRFLRHGVEALSTDSTSSPYIYSFLDGYTTLTQPSNPYFQHFAFSLGPVYRLQAGKIDWNIYATAGVILQEYHEFRHDVFALNPFTSLYENVKTPYASMNADKNPMAGVAIVGSKILYHIAPNFAMGVQVDYLTALGENGKYKVGTYDKLQDIKRIDFTKIPQTEIIQNNVNEYFGEELKIQSATIQALNASLVFQFHIGNSGGNKSKSNKGKQTTTIEVRDKITGELLSDATVQLLSADGDKIDGTTDKHGKFETNILKKGYVVTGRFNELNTTNETITINDLDNKEITKILYYDDDRFILKGTTIDCNTGKPIGGVHTQLTNTKDNKTQFTTSDAAGNFYFRLNQNADFQIVANENGKFSQTEILTTKGVNRQQTAYITLKLGVCEIEEGAAFEIKNILYDFDKSNIRSDAALVLNNVVNILQHNPNMEIELSSHTDSRGNNDYNQKLSQSRADVAVAYIISKGIQKHRLKAQGYGENKLKNHCKDGINCSESEHQQNRRTEIKIIKK